MEEKYQYFKDVCENRYIIHRKYLYKVKTLKIGAKDDCLNMEPIPKLHVI
jgi:hypothetical protein